MEPVGAGAATMDSVAATMEPVVADMEYLGARFAAMEPEVVIRDTGAAIAVLTPIMQSVV